MTCNECGAECKSKPCECGCGLPNAVFHDSDGRLHSCIKSLKGRLEKLELILKVRAS